MRFALFYHSLVSDWNHGNAHFLRGVVSELLASGHQVVVHEPRDGWSRMNLLKEHGAGALQRFERAYPMLTSQLYDVRTIDLDRALDGADVVIVHEWNDPSLVERIGRHRARGGGYVLLFHDTHHRCVTAKDEIASFRLDAFDGVLAFGEVLRERYLELGWAHRAFTWHEAADTRIFHPRPSSTPEGDVIWIGNWGEERSTELFEFLLDPVVDLGLRATVHGVRYPEVALAALRRRGVDFGGWIPNFEVPETFSRHRVAVHVPRRPYVRSLPGVPPIRVFEALACGIPLVCAPWEDQEELFRAGRDFLVARDGRQMRAHLKAVLSDPGLARELATHGLETIRARHTCKHRVAELLALVDRLTAPAASTSTGVPRISP